MGCGTSSSDRMLGDHARGVGPVAARAALTVVDIQNDFISGSLKVGSCPESIIKPINALRAEIPFDVVVHTQDSHPSDHCSFASNNRGAEVFSTIQIPAPDGSDAVMEQAMWPVHCVDGSPGWQFHPDLIVADSDLVQKKGTASNVDSYSGFFDNYKGTSTGLEQILRDRGITDVYVCGLAFDYCAGSTACDAAKLGFNTFLIEDLTCAVDARSAFTMAAKLAHAKVEIIKADRVLEHMQRRRDLSLKSPTGNGNWLRPEQASLSSPVHVVTQKPAVAAQ